MFDSAHKALLIPSDVNIGIWNPAVQMSVHFLVDAVFKSLPGFKPGGYVELGPWVLRGILDNQLAILENKTKFIQGLSSFSKASSPQGSLPILDNIIQHLL